MVNECSFCGIDLDEFPDHVEQCPECDGRLHVGEDGAACSGADILIFYLSLEVHGEGFIDFHLFDVGFQRGHQPLAFQNDRP